MMAAQLACRSQPVAGSVQKTFPTLIRSCLSGPGQHASTKASAKLTACGGTWQDLDQQAPVRGRNLMILSQCTAGNFPFGNFLRLRLLTTPASVSSAAKRMKTKSAHSSQRPNPPPPPLFADLSTFFFASFFAALLAPRGTCEAALTPAPSPPPTRPLPKAFSASWP